VLYILYLYLLQYRTTSKIDEIHVSARILPKLSETMVGEPPDASDWTPAEVAKFFHDMGFTEEALAFKNQVTLLLYAMVKMKDMLENWRYPLC